MNTFLENFKALILEMPFLIAMFFLGAVGCITLFFIVVLAKLASSAAGLFVLAAILVLAGITYIIRLWARS